MKKVILSVVMAAILVVGMVGTAFSFSQTWDLDSTGNGTEASPWRMVEVEDPNGPSGDLMINAGDTVYFISKRACNADTNFSGPFFWDLNLTWIGSPVPDSDDLTINVGTWIGGTFTAGDAMGWDNALGQTTYYRVGRAAFDITAGTYIALRITNTSGGENENYNLDTAGNSNLDYPGTETPSWPVPEIATIIMIVLGVMAIGGYVWYRRRQPVQVVA